MYALTPRFFAHDDELRNTEPLRTALSKRRDTRETRTGAGADHKWTMELAERMIQDAFWVST